MLAFLLWFGKTVFNLVPYEISCESYCNKYGSSLKTLELVTFITLLIFIYICIYVFSQH